MREEVGADLAADALRFAGGENAAARCDQQYRGDADQPRLLQRCLHDAYRVAAATQGQAPQLGPEFFVARELLRFVAPLGDPLFQGADLGVEQRAQARRANLPQGVARALIGPEADAEHGQQQAEQGDRRARSNGMFTIGWCRSVDAASVA
jgi:hypothetical protein